MASMPEMNVVVTVAEEVFAVTIGRWKVGLFRRSTRTTEDKEPEKEAG